MKAINHCLTSLVELRQIFKDRLIELGYVWDSAEKRYKSTKAEKPTDKPENTHVSEEKPQAAQEADNNSVEVEKPEGAADMPAESNAEDDSKSDAGGEGKN